MLYCPNIFYIIFSIDSTNICRNILLRIFSKINFRKYLLGILISIHIFCISSMVYEDTQICDWNSSVLLLWQAIYKSQRNVAPPQSYCDFELTYFCSPTIFTFQRCHSMRHDGVITCRTIQ